MTEIVTIMGSSGMLGAELSRQLIREGQAVRKVSRSESPLARDPDSLARLLDGSSIVFNCLAFTDVELAESREPEALEVNGNFVGRLAAACKKTGARLFHISTDYVFDGMSGVPYRTLDAPNPMTAYGRGKLAGERELLASSCEFSIFRTSWLYGADGSNFAKVVARKLIAGDSVRVVHDQIGSPTWSKDLSHLLMIYSTLNRVPRIVHATASGSCSWFEFAREIAISMGVDPDALVQPVSSSSYRSAASRPKFSVLDNSEGPIQPIRNWQERWRAAAPEVLASLD